MGAQVNVIIPTIGESISEGTIGRYFFKDGDIVQKDQTLFEVDSDKATLEVPSPATGKLKIMVPAGKTAKVGTLVAVIEASGNGDSVQASKKDAVKMPASTEKKTASKAEQSKIEISVTPIQTLKNEETAKVSTAPTDNFSDDQLKDYGPAKRKAIRSGAMKLPSQGSGMFFDESTNEMRKPMTTLRKRIAERLLQSQQTTATLTTFNEIDMSKSMAVRSKLKDSFQQKFGVKLGFMSFFSKAVVEALKAYPDVNARIDGDDLVYAQNINLGIAVSTDRGLVVPVIRNAQDLSFSGFEKKIAELAEKARDGKLQIPDMQGGTFTLTNGGVFGSLLSTPILNPPQSGILGMHKIEHRPLAVENGQGGYNVEVHPMMYVALSYDHRIIDGATSVGFLVKVKEFMESVTEAQVMA